MCRVLPVAVLRWWCCRLGAVCGRPILELSSAVLEIALWPDLHTWHLGGERLRLLPCRWEHQAPANPWAVLNACSRACISTALTG